MRRGELGGPARWDAPQGSVGYRRPEEAAVADIGKTLRDEHRRIRGALAENVGRALERGTRDDLNALLALLQGELLTHARAEQTDLYPAVDRLVHDHGRATATMEIDHEKIAAQVMHVAAAVERLRTVRERMPRMAARTELREALLRLDTLLDVHLEKEERVYVPLLETHLAPTEQERLLERFISAEHVRETADRDVLDVRLVPARDRHPLIFTTFDRLPVGGAFTLVSDHDPRPLSYQFDADRPSAFTWEYLERGPVWRVRIARTA